MMLTTGMSIFGKMSVGVRTIARPPKTRIRIASTTKVYGRFRASFTFHMSHSQSFHRIAGLNILTNLLLVPWSSCIEGRDQLLGRSGQRNCSKQNNFFCRNLLAVDAAVVAIVGADRGAFERDSGKQVTRHGVAQDFGTQGRVGVG